jgi:hypothetical protein
MARKLGCGACLLSLTLAVTAYGDDNTIDKAAMAGKAFVSHDGKGHYLVWVTDADSTNQRLFYGDAKTLHEVPCRGKARDEENGDTGFNFEDRRLKLGHGLFETTRQKGRVRCGDRETPVTTLPDADRRAFLARAELKPPRWHRVPVALARDEPGRYYYVDVEAAGGRKDYRLFAGVPGAMRKQKLKNLVNDTGGMVVSTPKGDLAIDWGSSTAVWTVRRKRTKLTLLPLEENGVLIHTDLGVYARELLGTPCDDL